MARTPLRVSFSTKPVRLTGGGIVKVTPRTTSVVDPAFSNLSTEQVSGTTNQARGYFTFTNRPSGTVYCRFVNAYAGQGKDIAGGFSLVIPININNTNYSVESPANLVVGNTYTPIYWWQDNPLLSTDVWPLGNAVEVGPAITITSPELAATVINPSSFNVVQGTTAGSLISQLTTDVLGGTFAQGSPTNPLINLSASGAITASTTLSTLGASTIKVIHTNAGGTKAQDVEMNVITAPVTSDKPTPSVTVSSVAAILAQLDTWLASPSLSHRCVGLDTSQPGVTLNLGSRNFSVANGHGGVTIRGVSGTYTENDTGPMSSIKLGVVNFGSAKNIVVSLVQASGAHLWGSSEDCGFKYAVVEGANRATSAANYSSTNLSTNNVLNMNTSVRAILYRSALMGGSNAIVDFDASSSGASFIGCAFDQSGHDNFKTRNGATVTDLTIDKCIMATRYINPGAAHSDFLQVYNSVLNNLTVTYSVFVMRDSFGTDSYPGNQGFFGGGNNWNFNQCFFAHNNGSTKFSGTGTNWTITYCSAYCTVPVGLTSGGDPWNTALEFSGHTRDYNVLTSSTTKSPGAGPNGLFISIGPTSTGTEYIDEIVGPMEIDCPAGNMEPVVGRRTHWDYGDPNGRVGCYDLMRLCFDPVDHDNWMDWGWPVRALCHVTLDTNFDFASSYGSSTTYDSNGNSI